MPFTCMCKSRVSNKLQIFPGQMLLGYNRIPCRTSQDSGKIRMHCVTEGGLTTAGLYLPSIVLRILQPPLMRGLGSKLTFPAKTALKLEAVCLRKSASLRTPAACIRPSTLWLPSQLAASLLAVSFCVTIISASHSGLCRSNGMLCKVVWFTSRRVSLWAREPIPNLAKRSPNPPTPPG